MVGGGGGGCVEATTVDGAPLPQITNGDVQWFVSPDCVYTQSSVYHQAEKNGEHRTTSLSSAQLTSSSWDESASGPAAPVARDLRWRGQETSGGRLLRPYLFQESSKFKT